MKPAQVPNVFRAITVTDAGIHAIWSPSGFPQITDYPTWEAELLDTADFERYVAAGKLVPLNLNSDGGLAVEVRIGTAAEPVALVDQEQAWVRATSEEYLYLSDGKANLSGVEYIDSRTTPIVKSFEVPPGSYAVKVFYLDSPADQRTPDDLYPPDLLVLMRPESSGRTTYRTSQYTFASLE